MLIIIGTITNVISKVPTLALYVALKWKATHAPNSNIESNTKMVE